MPRPKGLQLSSEMQRISAASSHDPFSVLGVHPSDALPGNVKANIIRDVANWQLVTFLPHARGSVYAELDSQSVELTQLSGSDFYMADNIAERPTRFYQLRWQDEYNNHYHHHDPYAFEPQISEYDLHLFAEGRNWNIHHILGAHPKVIDGIAGVLFATWAPGAERVSVVADFNRWDGRCHAMRSRGSSGVWELFIPGVALDTKYKFEIRARDTGAITVKTDPYGRYFETRPHTAARVYSAAPEQVWTDNEWMNRRRLWSWQHSPLSVYEMHLGSWQRDHDNQFLNYRELAHRLVEYVVPLGFTHIEILPVAEHPLDDSWGYQSTGYFAPTSRFGNPDDFRYFVNHLHNHNIGVILDWVPAHFPKDTFALARFDGTALYEHEDIRLGEHKDWGTLIFNYGRNEVRNFLIASALFWLDEFHLDGLRVDAVASMLHLDYSREAGEWLPNRYGGNENLEAVEFVRELNIQCHGQHPGVLVIAEESTAWPQVSGPVYLGGLGFSLKWNMGWMHDSLQFMSKDPIYRQYHHDNLTFGMMYAFSENFQLPFSHDEVVHGKGSMINKMPGDDWQKFANLRLLYTFQFTYPGSKLLFMGSEFGQWSEWCDKGELDWPLMQYERHQQLQQSVADLNGLYRTQPALYEHNYSADGFNWIDCHDNRQSVISYIRQGEHERVIVILNFTPTPRHDYRVGVPDDGEYDEIFNSDSTYYGGSNLGNGSRLMAEQKPWMNLPYSLSLTLPPLAGIVLKCRR
ncbi:1,4-alpha-glucan branching protein GlgB [uncultured Gilvimarinus sp.]|uniref:1,4-alpha-glucan branching protein GlgB n=1 Tax=uncultured Gilvimarinus sp. TaxID=1689143 RepID=UPI0030EF4BB5